MDNRGGGILREETGGYRGRGEEMRKDGWRGREWRTVKGRDGGGLEEMGKGRERQ